MLAMFLWYNSRWSPWFPGNAPTQHAPKVWFYSLLTVVLCIAQFAYVMISSKKKRVLEIIKLGNDPAVGRLNGKRITGDLLAADLEIKDGTFGPRRTAVYYAICGYSGKCPIAFVCTNRPADHEAWCDRLGISKQQPRKQISVPGVL